MTYSVEQSDRNMLGSTAAIRYELDFSRAAQHLVLVTLVVESITTDEVAITMPAWTPGSYRIRDYSANQGDVVVQSGRGDARKVLPYRWRDKDTIVIPTVGISSVEVTYTVYGYERSVRTNHITRNHAFIVPAATLMYVEERMNETHHVLLKHDQQVWKSVSTALSPVTTEATNRLFAASNYDVLVDSPLEIGNQIVHTFTKHNAVHEVAVTSSQPVDTEWIIKQVERIVDVEAQIFGGLPYDRYVFIIQVYPGGGGGLEHARSSVNAVDPSTFLDKSKTQRLLSLLCHEFFHVWNVKRIRPKALGPFDYQHEVYTPMLWLAEGLTSYYDDLLHYRCGFATEKEYFDTLAKEHLLKLDRVPGRHAMSVRDSSLLAWTKLYQAGADGVNRFPSYYLAGGVVMLLLDCHIISHTDGEKSLDHALRALWQRYLDNPSVGLTEDETIAIIERSTGVQLRELLLSWLNGVDELPVEEYMQKVGVAVTRGNKNAESTSFGEKREFAFVPPDVFVGWTLADANGRTVVKTVLDNSPAQVAGIGIDDELLCIDGFRIASSNHAGQLLAASYPAPVELVAQSDGYMYTTTLAAQSDSVVTVAVIADPTPQQLRNRQAWLQRTL